jgi:hypothetical protein
MSPSEIEELIEDEPFRPFRVTVTSGDQFVINNRHRVFISGLSLVAGLSDDPDDRMGKRLKPISIPNISVVEYIDPNQPKNRRRRR